MFLVLQYQAKVWKKCKDLSVLVSYAHQYSDDQKYSVIIYWIFSIITPVYSVTWSFKNHSNMLISCSIIDNY